MGRQASKSPRLAWLTLLVGVQLLLLGFTLAWLASVQDQVRMELETRLPEKAKAQLPSEATVLGTANLLTGPDFLGIDTPTEYQRGLSFLDGQMVWLFLAARLGDRDPLVGLAREATPKAREFQHLRAGLTDGSLCLLYDAGADAEGAQLNWTGAVAPELRACTLLPWSRNLDLVFLSSLEEGAVGGLGFITDVNQGVFLVAPPHDPGRLRKLGGFTRDPNVATLEVGLHPLGAGLWALVLKAPPGSGSPAELDLLVERPDGSLALFSGSGLNRPSVALRAARRLAGREVSLYVGATGYSAESDSSGMEADVRALKLEFPNLVMVPNANTTLMAHGLLEALLGPKYRPGRLGTRIRL